MYLGQELQMIDELSSAIHSADKMSWDYNHYIELIQRAWSQGMLQDRTSDMDGNLKEQKGEKFV